MTGLLAKWTRCMIWVSLVCGGPLARVAAAQMPAASTDSADAGWPRQLRSGTTTYSVYQPQLDSWEGNQLSARAAVAVQDTAAAEPAFGVIWLSARTDVDKTNRMVSLEDLRITKASFPSAPASAGDWQGQLEPLLAARCKTIALDRLVAQLAVQQEIQKASGQPLRNSPPRIIFSTVPAILVPIDGDPMTRPVGNGLDRVINTRPLLLERGGTFYLHVFDGWMQASAIGGPWTVTTSPPPSQAAELRTVLADNQVDLLDGTSADSSQAAPSLAAGAAPTIYVSTTPAELIVTDGAPDYVPLTGTQLLYVQNTTARLFKSIADNSDYVLISGRWYRAPSTDGPWTYVERKALPADFARIPDSSPVENVKASVPGTPQAQEAAIENSIPETATVNRAGTTLDPAPTIDGEPEYAPIEGTGLQYVVNSSLPIIETGTTAFYAVQNGIWFDATSVLGPWSVAVSVPAEIYAIPPSSPLYYVTFVQVYGSTNEVAYVGYTPGYYGTVMDPDDIVVYGTGYYYRPWIGRYWFGYPLTYGFGASVRWTPWTGWGFGFGFGRSWGFGLGMAWGGWGWGPRPWWGPSAWWWGLGFPGRFDHARSVRWRGRGGWDGTSGDVYARWDRARVVNRTTPGLGTWRGGLSGTRMGVAYNSHNGIREIGQRGTVPNIRTVGRLPAATRRGPGRIQVPERPGAGQPALGRTQPEQPSGARGAMGRDRIPERPSGGRSALGRTQVPEQPGAGRDAGDQTLRGREPNPGVVRAPVPAPRVGGSAHPGDDLYAGPRGEVFRRSPSGNWEQRTGTAWRPAGEAVRPQLGPEAHARAQGAQRAQDFRALGGGMRGGMQGGRRGGR